MKHMHMAVCKDYCFLENLMIAIKAGVFIKHVVQIKGAIMKRSLPVDILTPLGIICRFNNSSADKLTPGPSVKNV